MACSRMVDVNRTETRFSSKIRSLYTEGVRHECVSDALSMFRCLPASHHLGSSEYTGWFCQFIVKFFTPLAATPYALP